MTNKLEEALYNLENEKLTSIIYDGKSESSIQTSNEKGIKPLIKWYTENQLNGMQVYDKIIGRAAAFVLINGGAVTCYARFMSVGAVELLKQNNLEVTYGEMVPIISNRDKTGMCPMEQSVEGITEPKEGLQTILDFIQRRSKGE